MMPDPKLDQVARAHLAELCQRFPIGYEPMLLWKPYRVTAGMAYFSGGEIGLSHLVLKTPEAVRETLGHEYAHLLAYARHGRRARGHGLAWQRAMHDLGLEPKVRHNYEVIRNSKRRQVSYRCKRCGQRILRNRRLPRNRRYVHATCGGDLELVAVVRVMPAGQTS